MLVAKGLGVEIGDRAIGPFDLEVGIGEVVALVGANGSGKTTFIRLALGLDRSSFGGSWIRGFAVDPLSPPRGVGYVADRAEFWDWMNAIDNLALVAADYDDISDVLVRVGLDGVKRRTVKTFSRGMRQRLSIARALLSAPELLVMDEPTIALDEEAADQLGTIIREWRESGRSVLLASHDDEFVKTLDARIVRLINGVVA
jgi:ABC-type multidrug transport system ATPase subunit